MKKGLFLIRGECFRIGPQGSRKIENKETDSPQKIASENHLSLINHIINSHNINLHLIIHTQSTEYNSVLEDLYQSPFLKKINYLEKYEACQMNSLKKVYESIKNDLDQYDFIFLSRCDIVFKKDFFKIFNPYESKVMFPFICWYKERKTKKGNPRPSDIFFYIPKKYFHLLEIINRIPCTQTLHEFLDYSLVIDSELEYGVYINTYHDSDPNKDLNPLYYLPGRGEVDFMVSDQNLKFPEDF